MTHTTYVSMTLRITSLTHHVVHNQACTQRYPQELGPIVDVSLAIEGRALP